MWVIKIVDKWYRVGYYEKKLIFTHFEWILETTDGNTALKYCNYLNGGEGKDIQNLVFESLKSYYKA